MRLLKLFFIMEKDRAGEYKELMLLKYPKQEWASEFILDTSQLGQFFQLANGIGPSYTFTLAPSASTTVLSRGRKLWMMPWQIDFKVTGVPTLAGQRVGLITSNADTNATYITFDLTSTAAGPFVTPPVEDETFSVTVTRTKIAYYRHSTGQSIITNQASSQAGKTYEFGIYAQNAAGAPVWAPVVSLVFGIRNFTIL